MIRKNLLRVTLTGVALTIAAVACSPDRIAAPAPQASGSLLGGLVGTVTTVTNTVTGVILPAVKRTTALPSDVTVVQTIGSAGGTISIPQAGVRVIFAPGAVSTPTTITATANAGSYLAYTFSPHITFNAPVTVAQDMSHVQTTGLLGGLASLQGGYMQNGILDLNTVLGTVTVTEQLPATSSVVTAPDGHSYLETRYDVKHFSGYILTGGRQ
jgi:hypothetical protein